MTLVAKVIRQASTRVNHANAASSDCSANLIAWISAFNAAAAFAYLIPFKT